MLALHHILNILCYIQALGSQQAQQIRSLKQIVEEKYKELEQTKEQVGRNKNHIPFCKMS